MNSIASLIQLQEIDGQLQEIRELLGDLPLKVDELSQNEKSAVEEIDHAKTRIKEIELNISKKDHNAKVIQEKIQKLKDQLFLVKTNKQYDALSQEIDFLKEELDSIETNELELTMEKDQLLEKTEKQENNLGSLTSNLHERRSNLESLIAESSEKKEQLKKDRELVISDLSDTIVSKYNRVFSARGGLGVVEVLSSSCSGCGSMVPPQKLAEVKKGDSISSCDVCNRFLYWPSKTA
ncbi:MAG: zinc ribbon domain-containing protein [Fidelibacterota bacterium]